jgi:hypothetical protein
METTPRLRSIFDMSSEEFEQLVTPVALETKQTALDNGAWFSYKNDLCVTGDMFIHEFKDGRKELIQLGDQTGVFTILKVYY